MPKTNDKLDKTCPVNGNKPRITQFRLQSSKDILCEIGENMNVGQSEGGCVL